MQSKNIFITDNISENTSARGNKELSRIKSKYSIALIVRVLRMLIKQKKEAHEIIVSSLMREINDVYIISTSTDTLLNLFPEEEYLYIGSKYKDLKDGFGKQKFMNSNAVYYGMFRNDYRVDMCRYINTKQEYEYKGYVKKNFADGYGITENYRLGHSYEGEHMLNKKEGYGIETYSDGSYYQGEYKNGHKEGIGIYKWSDGSFYEGEWNGDKISGYGKYKFTMGKVYIGHWENNKMNGFGEFINPNERVYIGHYYDDKRQGFGIMYWYTERKAYIGYWCNNKQNGKGKYYFKEKESFAFFSNRQKEKKYKSQEEFESLLDEEEIKYLSIYRLHLDEIESYINNHSLVNKI